MADLDDAVEWVFGAVRYAANGAYMEFGGTAPDIDITPMALILSKAGGGAVDLSTVPIAPILDGSPKEVDQRIARFLTGILTRRASPIDAVNVIGVGIVVPVWSVEGEGVEECEDLIALHEEYGTLQAAPGVGEGVLCVFVTKDGPVAQIAKIGRVEGQSILGAWDRHTEISVPWAKLLHQIIADTDEDEDE